MKAESEVIGNNVRLTLIAENNRDFAVLFGIYNAFKPVNNEFGIIMSMAEPVLSILAPLTPAQK